MGARGGYDDEDDAEEFEEEEEDEGEYVVDEEEEEEEDEEVDRRKRKRKQASKFIDDVAEEDDDEDEEEQAAASKRKKRDKVAHYLDDVAGVDEDADEEDELDAEDDFVVHEPSMNERRLATRPPLLHNEDDGLENLEKMIQNRYSRQGIEDYDETEATEVEQKALLPSVKDPKLWMLTCQQGREREAAACLMQKYFDLLARGEQLNIKSAVAIDHLKGFIYVEAEKEAYVRQAVSGLRTIYPKNVHLVPIKEMTDVLNVEKKSMDIDKENWVRVKNGLYKDDLARVHDVDHVRQRARIKLVPRIDLANLVAKMEGREANKPKGFASRPPPRFINLQDLKDLKIPVDKKRDSVTRDVYDQIGNGSIQLLKGYVVKNVSLKTLNPVESMPSLAELQKFQKPGEEDELDVLGLSSSARKKGSFMKGDTVVVTEGDLKFLMGTVEKVDEDQVEMRPKNSELKDLLRFHTRQLSKFFRTGDHVKVISGKHEGATGMIVKVENQAVVILSDTSKENIRVFKDSIVESSEVTSGLTKLGEFELHDLIALDQMTVGVIVRIEADGCQVLKGTPDKQEVVTVKQRDLRRRPFNKQANTQDRDMNAVSVKDIVRVVDGPFKGKQGPVEHISRGIIFIIDRHHLENGGFLCVRASSCVALGGSRGDKHNSITSNFASLKPPSQYLQSPRRSPVRGAYGPPPSTGFVGRQGGGRRHDALLGRIVKIRLGPYKGYRGRVKDVNDGNIRIELESQMKVVSVRRDQLSEVGDNPSVFSSSFKEPSRYGMGSETPMHPSRTPLHPSMTPMRDITATPLHEGMRTPMRDRAWNPFTTPLRDSSDDGGWGSSGSPQYLQQPGTPLANRSYEAPTPGSGWSPGASYSDSGSPADSAYVPGTPGALPMTPAAPSYLPGTPGGQPMTPGDPTSPTAYNTHESERQWALPDVIVTLRRHGESHIGVIQDVLPDGQCRVALGPSGEGETVTASQSELEMVPTRKNDIVKIVSGEFRGCSGRLIGIDGGEGIVRVDNLDVKILEMSTLGKKFDRLSVP